MKKILIAIAAISLTVGACKKKDDSQTPSLAPEVRYAKFSAAIYKAAPKSTWVAALNKAEDVTLIKKITVDKKEYAFVTTAAGKEGYIDASYLAGKPFVVTDASVTVYASPTLTARKVMRMPRGVVGFVLEEKAGWVKIYAGQISENYDYSKDEAGKYKKVSWVNDVWIESSGFSYDLSLVAQGVEFGNLLLGATNGDADKQNAAKDKLKKIQDDAANPLSKAACAALNIDTPEACGEAKPAEQPHG